MSDGLHPAPAASGPSPWTAVGFAAALLVFQGQAPHAFVHRPVTVLVFVLLGVALLAADIRPAKGY